MISLGLDIGSSSIKAALVETDTGVAVATASYPDTEMTIAAPSPGFAEQDPELWWQCVKEAVARLRSQSPKALAATRSIGISYQMHGLVLLDRAGTPLLPSIIWCDSRAAAIGRDAFDALGHDWCLTHLLNSPGNFTASKLRWVIEHRPEIARRAVAFLLPGDFIAYKLTGEMNTTISGLSEGTLWDFRSSSPATRLMDQYGISPSLIPPLVPTFGPQGTVTAQAAVAFGVPAGTPVTYRAGDQPNNALALNVLEPGEIAATAGTSGVVYAVSGDLDADPESRINSFAHVNHTPRDPRIGILLCVNGTGIANSWSRRITGNAGIPYTRINEIAAGAPVGAGGIVFLPFGNGAERLFGDRIIGAHLLNVDFTRHATPDLLRAVQEGIAFSLVRGIRLMGTLGVTPTVIRTGVGNMFLSPLFCEALATSSGIPIEIYQTDGAQGAARGAAAGAGTYASLRDAATGLQCDRTIEPTNAMTRQYGEAFDAWNDYLEPFLAASPSPHLEKEPQ